MRTESFPLNKETGAFNKANFIVKCSPLYYLMALSHVLERPLLQFAL